MTNISTKLKAWRGSQGLNQGQVADLLGVRQATVSRLENGEQGLSLDLGRKLIALGAITADDMLAPPASASKAA